MAPATSGPEGPIAPGTASSDQGTPATGSAPGSSVQGPPPGEPPPGVRALPAVSVKTMGLHVGGGPNDAEGKAPFLQALEASFPDFLKCYQLVEEPGAGGSFGVDLHIAQAGGKPQVEQPRSRFGGESFRTCMISAFEKVSFPRLKKAFVISYSLRFNVEL